MTTTVITDTPEIVLPFTGVHYTNAINQLPSQFGQMAAEGMFPVEPMASALVEVDISAGVISALPVTDPEAPSTFSRKNTEEARYFRVPNISHLHTLKAADIRGILEKAARSANPKTLIGETNKELIKLRRKADITLELMRTSALKGVVVDGAGTEIYNFFTAFGVTKKVVYFDLGTTTTKVLDKCQEVIGHIEDNLSDETMTNVAAKVSTQFFNKLIGHAKVEPYWLNWQAASALANPATIMDGQYRPRIFTFGNITFVENSANVPMWGGSSSRIITAGLGHAYPVGTGDTHYTYAAPPVDIRALNAPGSSDTDLLHVTDKYLDHGAGLELKGQMNCLPLWRRPALLVELSDAAS
ncbi:MAG: major capsid protein [Caulobacter sp.]|nr:major capsid protein [Caulobacter sp.]